MKVSASCAIAPRQVLQGHLFISLATSTTIPSRWVKVTTILCQSSSSSALTAPDDGSIRIRRLKAGTGTSVPDQQKGGRHRPAAGRRDRDPGLALDLARAALPSELDDRFMRKWSYYLSYCEAAFALRNISVVHTLHTRANNLAL